MPSLLERGDILDGNWIASSYDVISAMGSLHHLTRPLDGFRLVSDALEAGGIFVFHYYGSYGRYARRLDQEAVRLLSPDSGDFTDRVEVARRLFKPIIKLTGDSMPAQWIVDQYAHPCEQSSTASEAPRAA